ncbi:PaaI family thioesterase [Streptodolium elevatio]|uniref:Acyl-coenzyme A thioesterase THEM4 n=1 Tax=Streptodolium elevatio TaxID=3157996 RepID=A0ABV3DR18_9ACTN
MAEPGTDTDDFAALEQLIVGEIPDVTSIPDEALDLVEQVRDLVEATVLTDVGADVRSAAAGLVAQATELLKAATHPSAVRFARTPDGRIDQLAQAGSGMLNPQAPRMVIRPVLDAVDVGAEPRSVEVVADCVLTAAHSGPPGRAHGGVVATLLDHLLGIATSAAGRPGFTAGLEIRYRDATPYDVPLEVRARWTHRDGRKSFATGEILAQGRVTAEATGVFVAPRDMQARWQRDAEARPEPADAGQA